MRTLTKGLRHLLVLSLLLGSGLLFAPAADAQDNSLLFPFITTESGKFTFITILNDGGTLPITSYHYTYATKAAPIVNKAGCDHFDGDGLTTNFDMVAFEVAGKVKTDPPSAALFEGGSTIPVTSGPVTLFVTGRIGFLIVEANPIGDQPEIALSGNAAVIDTATGLTFSYSTAFLTGFNGNMGEGEGAPANTHRHFVNWYPDSIVTTSWYVVPVSFRSAMTTTSGASLRLALTASTRSLGGGAFDLDEHFFSGVRTTPIRCLGIVKRTDFLQPNTAAATAGGGWTRTVGGTTTLAITDPDDPGSATGQVYSTHRHVMYKIQTTTVFGSPITVLHREPNAAVLFPPIFFGGVNGDTP